MSLTESLKKLDRLAFPSYTPGMSDTARDYQTTDHASIEGFEDLLEIVPTAADTLADTTRDVPTDADSFEWLSIVQAAARLDKSERTIHRYIKAAKVRSKTDQQGRLLVGLSALADRFADTEIFVPTAADTQAEALTDADTLSTDSRVNDLDSHLELIKELQGKLEVLTYRNGYLESKLEDREQQIKLLTDSQHKPSRWAAFKKWFFGQ